MNRRGTGTSIRGGPVRGNNGGNHQGRPGRGGGLAPRERPVDAVDAIDKVDKIGCAWKAFGKTGRPDFVDCVECVDFVEAAGTRGGLGIGMLVRRLRIAPGYGRITRETEISDVNKPLSVNEPCQALLETKQLGVSVESILSMIEEFKAAGYKLFG